MLEEFGWEVLLQLQSIEREFEQMLSTDESSYLIALSLLQAFYG